MKILSFIYEENLREKLENLLRKWPNFFHFHPRSFTQGMTQLKW